MANPEYLALLKQGATAWNEWRQSNPGIYLDLRKADLSRAKLSGANLGWAYLDEANLRAADLRAADLHAADLRAADLRAADLRAADLRAADLRGADLRGADLRGANLTKSNLTKVCLNGANLSEANLREVNLEGVDLRKAKLDGRPDHHRKPLRAFMWRVLGIIVVIAGFIVWKVILVPIVLLLWMAVRSIAKDKISITLLAIADKQIILLLTNSAASLHLTWILSFFVMARFFRKARRYTTYGGRERLIEDRRPPVLYLRSFVDDKSAAAMHGWTTEEEQLARVMEEVGPFIAIGSPGEELPELGAARVYLKDEYWQEWVTAKMECARLVIIRSGETEGFWWELRQAGRVLNPECLLLLIDCDEPQYELFRQRAQNYLPGRLPDFRKTKIRCGNLRGIIYFERDWSSHFLTFNNINRSYLLYRFRPMAIMLKMCLQPVFQQLEIAWVPPRIWLQMTLLVFSVVGFLLMVLLTLLHK